MCHVIFKNSYSSTVSVAVLIYNPFSCGGGLGDWEKGGWYNIDPGNQVEVAQTPNKYIYYYAEAADGSFWAGATGPIDVPTFAFDMCVWDQPWGIPWPVGFREVDLGGWAWVPFASYTVNLTS